MLPDYIIDVHTHAPGRPNALLSLPPRKALAGYKLPFSLELHPWYLGTAEEAEIKVQEMCQAFDQLPPDCRPLAIGECGLDNHCKTPLEVQLLAFRSALSLARKQDLPVIIHCVGYWSEMMQCCQEIWPASERHQPLIVHGFRKGPQLAQQLLHAGLDLSLGERFNTEVACLVPSDRLWFETDESSLDIESIRKSVLSHRDSLSD